MLADRDNHDFYGPEPKDGGRTKVDRHSRSGSRAAANNLTIGKVKHLDLSFKALRVLIRLRSVETSHEFRSLSLAVRFCSQGCVKEHSWITSLAAAS